MRKFKKSEIAIYALSLMLVAAGYFNYINLENGKILQKEQDIAKENAINIGEAILVSNNEVIDSKNEAKEENINLENEIHEESSETRSKTNNDYYINSKIEREKMYAEMISNYEKFLNSDNLTDLQKNIIVQEITKINNTKNSIMICENLILTKGFTNCIIFVNENSINIIAESQNGLDKENVAKIENIISREFNVNIQDIHISERK